MTAQASDEDRETDKIRDRYSNACRHHRDGPETCDCGLDAARTAAPEPKEPM